MKKVALLAVATMVLGSGCGKTLKSFKFDFPEKNKFDFNFTLDKQYQLDLAGGVDVMDYGKVYFEKPTAEAGSKMGLTFNMGKFVKDEWVTLESTGNLPNGEKLPGYVSHNLIKVDVPAVHNGYVTPYLYFGMKEVDLEASYKVPFDYVGLALEINKFDASFPQGLQVSQTFFNKYNQPIVGATLYGPKMVDGELAVPGGFFVAANIENIVAHYATTEKGLKIGFDNGGMSMPSLYRLNQRVKGSISETPAQVMKTKSANVNAIDEHHNNGVINSLIDSANF